MVDQLFKMAWVTGDGVTDPDTVRHGLDGAGLNGADLVRRAADRDNKDRLKRRTNEAVEAGVFGVPTVGVDAELFWGQDSFPHLERYLRGEDPLGDITPWLDIPVGAER